MTVERNHDWLGTFRGSGLSEEALDGLLAFSLNDTDLDAARSLQETKWWDYRFIHPGYGYFLFAHEFAKASEQWRTMFGVSMHARLSASDHPIWRAKLTGKGNAKVKEHILSPPSYRTSLWRGMCHADAYGVPYDRWVGLAFEFAFECKWERMPAAQGLYSKGVADYVTQRWAQEKNDILRLPVDPAYLPANYQGHRWQDAQYEWLIELIRNRPLPHIPLAQYMFREKRLPVDLAANRLGYETVAKARSLYLAA